MNNDEQWDTCLDRHEKEHKIVILKVLQCLSLGVYNCYIKKENIWEFVLALP